MTNTTYGAIKLSTADSVSRMLMKKLDSETGFKPSEWTDNINLLGALPIRTASGTIAHFEDGADDVPMKSVVANIVPIQEGTGTPSPSNPRPISGTSVLNVEQRGLNIFDKKPFSDWVIKSPYIVLNDNLPKNELLTMVFIDKDTSIDISGCYLGFVKDTYNGGTVQNKDYHWTLQNGTVRGRTDNVAEFGTDLCNYLMMYPTNEATYNKIFSRFDIMVVVGASTATTYEPYSGSTYPVPLGQTVYGGSADVVGGSGTSDLKYLEIDGTEASIALDSAPNVVRLTLSDLPSSNVSSQDYRYWGSESIYKYAATSNLNNNEVTMRTSGYLYYKNTNCTTLSDFQTFFATQKANGTPFTVCYELATPTEYTFTGQPINSYLGVNNLYTDSGEVLDVEYRADMNLLIASLQGNRGLQMMRATPTEEMMNRRQQKMKAKNANNQILAIEGSPYENP